MLRRAALAMLWLTLLMGHDHGCGQDVAPTEATCDASLTWTNFGEPFMARYCTRCHGSGVRGGERRGAAVDHNFDTPEGVRALREHVDMAAAAGPAATNVQMPPYGDAPTQLEREQLGGWLACGAP